MATNRGDALLEALRTVLLAVSGLPAQRALMNEPKELSTTQSSIDDLVVTWDTEEREVGPNAWRHSEVLYRIGLRVPVHTAPHAALALAATIEDAYKAASMTVEGNPLDVVRTRKGPVIAEKSSLLVPIYLSLEFDHA